MLTWDCFYMEKNIKCLNLYRLKLELKVDFCSGHISQLAVPERSTQDHHLTCHVFISLAFCLQLTQYLTFCFQQALGIGME